MKTLISKYWLVLMALVSVTLFTACSSDDDDAVTPVFPQVQTISGEAGEVKEFTFEANESWSLSSDKIWCKLVQGEKIDASYSMVLQASRPSRLRLLMMMPARI